jgi:hypothetical protein
MLQYGYDITVTYGNKDDCVGLYCTQKEQCICIHYECNECNLTPCSMEWTVRDHILHSVVCIPCGERRISRH